MASADERLRRLAVWRALRARDLAGAEALVADLGPGDVARLADALAELDERMTRECGPLLDELLVQLQAAIVAELQSESGE